MLHSYSIFEIKSAEEEMIKKTSATQLMRSAAEALAETVSRAMKEKRFSDVLFVCGGGNNGGDGFCAAQILFEQGKDVAVLCLSRKFSRECAEMAARYRGELFGRIPRRRFALIVDCVLGTGIKSAPEGDAATLIRFISDSGAYVISCDLPSGLTENGIALSPCVKADETLSLGGLKSALCLADGADVAGKISVADLGLEPKGGAELYESADIKAFFPKRKSHVHKGNFGCAEIFAGGAVYSGAAFLSASACLKSGVGYTRLSAVDPLYSNAIGKLPACVLREFRGIDGEMLSADCIAMGMGAGVNERVYAYLVEILPKYTGTLVLDADALNALSEYGTEILKTKSCRVIITPHPREFSRLLGLSTAETLSRAAELCKSFSEEYGVVVVLKNNRTLIAEGNRLAVNLTGTPALAKGGSGDVLTGLIAGTCARGVSPFESACVSSYLLGKAGELAESELGEYSVDASDVVRWIPKAILSL